MPYKLVIFDFDGTLVDTKSSISKAVNQTLAAHGYPQFDEARIHALVGLPLDEVFAGAMSPPPSPTILRGLTQHYRDLYDEIARESARAFPGVPELLIGLKDAGVLMSIATSKGVQSVAAILNRNGLGGLFACVLTNEGVTEPKPHPEMVHRTLARLGISPAAALVVGDTTYDLQMGGAAGTDTCGVMWGVHPQERLQAETPTYTVESCEQLRTILLS